MNTHPGHEVLKSNKVKMKLGTNPVHKISIEQVWIACAWESVDRKDIENVVGLTVMHVGVSVTVCTQSYSRRSRAVMFLSFQEELISPLET